MRAFSRLPVRQRLTVITMIASGVALLLAGIAFTTYEVVVFRRTLVEQLDRTANILGDSSSAALSFRDPQSAVQTLRSLASDPHILAAVIYDERGAIFATYRSAAAKTVLQIPEPREDGHHFSAGTLELFQSITLANEKSGTIYLVSDLAEMDARLLRYLLIAGPVLLASSFVAWLLARRLHPLITRLILHLSDVAGTVAVERNYSVRAVKEADDEIGRLIDGFNEMLAQIQVRDVELKAARETLEQRVAERTQQLSGEVAERRRSEAALLDSNQRFELVARATTEVIWDWDISKGALWWNENLKLVFGYDPAANTSIDSWSSRIHPEDAPGLLASVHAVIDGEGHRWSGEYRFRRADGAYADVFDRGYVLRDEQGRALRMIGALQDITQRRVAQDELARAHRELVEASRRAGQAEVATSVLHNVGNVLNSVIVSSNLALDRMRGLRLHNLTRVAGLLEENRAGLGPFFTEDPKGQVLPGYLRDLSRQLNGERTGVHEELEALKRHVEHIKAIITRQQDYARSVGVLENVSIVTVVEDAVALNADSLAQHAITVVRRFAAVPAFPIDKHRLMQILVNLVRNAKDALKAASAQEPRRLELEVTCTSAGTVQVRVSDNGIGIAPENLTRIFQHGFTTRRDGHGFGLHSGALAARQLGGSLSVQSDGPGRGAVFVLELPGQKDSSC